MSSGTPDSSPTRIGIDWTDEQILLFLAERRNEDPLPSNVVVDVNPFSIEPWIEPDQTWFLCKNEYPNGPIKAFQGYWEQMNTNIQLFSGTLIEGRKILWVFHMGNAPSGIRTGWTMLEYKMEHKEFCEQARAHFKHMDFNSLCILHWHNINEPLLALSGEERNCNGEDIKSDYVDSALLNFRENQESSSPMCDTTNRSSCDPMWVVHESEQGTLLTSSRKQEVEPNNNSIDLIETCDFANGDFIELKDFDDDLEYPSSSDSSSSVSVISDEGFDSDALLRDLEIEYQPIMTGSRKDGKETVNGSPRAKKTVNGLTSSGYPLASVSVAGQTKPTAYYSTNCSIIFGRIFQW